jgi:hypothetical protein
MAPGWEQRPSRCLLVSVENPQVFGTASEQQHEQSASGNVEESDKTGGTWNFWAEFLMRQVAKSQGAAKPLIQRRVPAKTPFCTRLASELCSVS